MSTAEIAPLLTQAPVVPVVVIEDADDAIPLAEALVAGGLPTIEVTLRTPAALEAISRIADAVPGACVGAGTVVLERDVDAAVRAGARFLVSPGGTPLLLDAMDASGLPYLPGTSSASEVVVLLERGLEYAKFFPAEAAGGVDFLRSLAGPFPGVKFCPTGGITSATAPSYLALPNVVCVGGSWLTPHDALATGDWDRVRQLAAEASRL